MQPRKNCSRKKGSFPRAWARESCGPRPRRSPRSRRSTRFGGISDAARREEELDRDLVAAAHRILVLLLVPIAQAHRVQLLARLYRTLGGISLRQRLHACLLALREDQQVAA